MLFFFPQTVEVNTFLWTGINWIGLSLPQSLVLIIETFTPPCLKDDYKHGHHKLVLQSKSLQSMTCCGLLLQCHVSDCNAFLQHVVLEICSSGFTFNHCVRDVVASGMACFGLRCWLPGCLQNTVCDLMVRGISEAHELFCFIWCSCSLQHHRLRLSSRL